MKPVPTTHEKAPANRGQSFYTRRTEQVAALAARHALPAVFRGVEPHQQQPTPASRASTSVMTGRRGRRARCVGGSRGQEAVRAPLAPPLIKSLAICYRVIAYSTSSLGSKRTAPGRAALGRAPLGLACFEVDFATCLDAWVVVVFFFG